MILSAYFMYWLFEIGAGICGMFGRLIDLIDVYWWGLSWQWELYIEAA